MGFILFFLLVFYLSLRKISKMFVMLNVFKDLMRNWIFWLTLLIPLKVALSAYLLINFKSQD